VLLKSAEMIIDLGVHVNVASTAVVQTETFAHSISSGNVIIVITLSCFASVAKSSTTQSEPLTKTPHTVKV